TRARPGVLEPRNPEAPRCEPAGPVPVPGPLPPVDGIAPDGRPLEENPGGAPPPAPGVPPPRVPLDGSPGATPPVEAPPRVLPPVLPGNPPVAPPAPPTGPVASARVGPAVGIAPEWGVAMVSRVYASGPAM